MSGEDAGQERSGEEVGSLGEEAARLLGALSGWAREHGAGPTVGGDPEPGPAAEDLFGRARAAWSGLDEHLATGAPECTVCPVCRTVHAVRGLSPEVRDHLAAAAGSALQALSAFLSTAPPREPSGERSPSGVQPIDLDDNWPDDAPPGDPGTDPGDGTGERAGR